MDKIFELIMQGDFKKVLCYPEINNDEFREKIGEIAYDVENITLYGFTHFMYSRTGETKWLHTMILMLSTDFCWIDGAYALALFYLRQLLKKDRSAQNLQFMLSLYNTPDIDIDEKEIRELVREILERDPNNSYAKQIELSLNRNASYRVENDKTCGRNNITRFYDLIMHGDFEEALAQQYAFNDEIYKMIYDKACDRPDITFLGFSQFMYSRTLDVLWLETIINMLCHAFNRIDGAYELALFNQNEFMEKTLEIR